MEKMRKYGISEYQAWNHKNKDIFHDRKSLQISAKSLENSREILRILPGKKHFFQACECEHDSSHIQYPMVWHSMLHLACSCCLLNNVFSSCYFFFNFFLLQYNVYTFAVMWLWACVLGWALGWVDWMGWTRWGSTLVRQAILKIP